MCTWLPQEFLLHPCLFAMLQSLASAQIQARECTCPIPLMKRYLVTQESGNNNCEDLFFCKIELGQTVDVDDASIFCSSNPPCREDCLKLVDF